jgi:hypothetical protein
MTPRVEPLGRRSLGVVQRIMRMLDEGREHLLLAFVNGFLRLADGGGDMLIFRQREARRQRQRDAKADGSESVSAMKHYSSQE